jgi:hypothetical protein
MVMALIIAEVIFGLPHPRRTPVIDHYNATNTSGVRGVHWYASKGKWRARIKVNNKYIELGLFNDLESAARVREAAALKYYGEFQRK